MDIGCSVCGKTHVELQRGLCADCEKHTLAKSEGRIAKADGKALADLSRKLLTDAKSKKDASTPQILEAAVRELGGLDQVGYMIAAGWRKASGNITAEEHALGAKPNANLEQKYAALVAQISMKEDERETRDVSSLTDEDLRNSLISLARDLLQENADFRRLAVLEGIRLEPSLIHEAMNIAGMPVADGQSEPVAKPEPEEEPEETSWPDPDWESEATDDA